IVVGTSGAQSYIQCYHHDGRLVAGFPAPIGNYDTQIFGYSVGDINGDGRLEIIVLANYRLISGTYRVYVMRLNGTVLPGWPFDVGQWPTGAPAVVDVDNDGQQDICFTAFDGSVYALAGNGQLVPGFPKKMSFASTSGVSVGDVDGDGLLELITATMIGGVYVWDLPTPAYRENSDWPMRHINPRNTNVFGDRLLGRNDCELSGDNKVDWRDFSLFALSWLQSSDNLPADFSHDGRVDFADLARCAQYWLEGITP
ncbi:MAG: FG-GAP-like repeat-containing protein, partial [Planctomycetota bacterium]|nr:FG-GAP-like repeat-containing protein [Planctomycetota bacterium]